MNYSELEIVKYDFTENITHSLQDNYFAQNLWPLVYIIEGDNKNDDKKIAYVGETTDVIARMSTHLKNEFKKELNSVNIIRPLQII